MAHGTRVLIVTTTNPTTVATASAGRGLMVGMCLAHLEDAEGGLEARADLELGVLEKLLKDIGELLRGKFGGRLHSTFRESL